jgi:hypothetical protein
MIENLREKLDEELRMMAENSENISAAELAERIRIKERIVARLTKMTNDLDRWREEKQNANS